MRFLAFFAQIRGVKPAFCQVLEAFWGKFGRKPSKFHSFDSKSKSQSGESKNEQKWGGPKARGVVNVNTHTYNYNPPVSGKVQFSIGADRDG